MLDTGDYGANFAYVIAQHTVMAAPQAAQIALASEMSAAPDISLQVPTNLDVPVLAAAKAPAPILTATVLSESMEPQIAALLLNWNTRSNTSLLASLTQKIGESRLQTTNRFAEDTRAFLLTEAWNSSDQTAPLGDRKIAPISAALLDEDEWEDDDLDFINDETLADYQTGALPIPLENLP